jgi:hypothetical protein
MMQTPDGWRVQVVALAQSTSTGAWQHYQRVRVTSPLGIHCGDFAAVEDALAELVSRDVDPADLSECE